MGINSFIKIFKKSYTFNDNLLKYLSLINNYKFYNWEKYVKKDEENYFRNTVFRNENFEILIITWLPGQKTPIHHHPKNGCLMKILEGKLKETAFKNNDIFNTIYKENDASYIHDDIGRHIISNESDTMAVSLHIYSPPNFYKKKTIN